MFRKSIKISIIAVYLVIIAGAVVRMTGSGMGCPDWPKCFGYYIPPTEISELEWAPERTFKKGQVIIKDEALYVAKEDFTTTHTYQDEHWALYTKHDYATFNVWHTWIEYINRLFGALSGFAILYMAILSFKKWKTKKQLTVLSWVSVVLLLFQAWLGATVVYSVLSPVKITIHMVMALVILAVLLYLLYASQDNPRSYLTSKNYKGLIIFAVLLTLIQVVLGTQVREFVDERVKEVGYSSPSLWLENPGLDFYFHRSFSIIMVIVNLMLWYFNKKNNYGLKYLSLLIWLILAEAFTGILMYYFDFPILTQALHLVLATLLFGVQFYILLEAFQTHRTTKSL